LFGITLKYGVPLDPSGERDKVVLDIGFGLGDSLIYLAERHRDVANVLGIELLQSGVAQALERIQSHGLDNCKIVRCDVLLLLQQNLVDDCLDEVYVLFPDPWPNESRDSQRRVIRRDIVSLLERKLKKKETSRLYVATDVEEYSEYVRALLATMPKWSLVSFSVSEPGERGGDVDPGIWPPPTKYELRAKELQHKVYHHVYSLVI